jgi:hypothetical protein
LFLGEPDVTADSSASLRNDNKKTGNGKNNCKQATARTTANRQRQGQLQTGNGKDNCKQATARTTANRQRQEQLQTANGKNNCKQAMARTTTNTGILRFAQDDDVEG